MQIGSRSTLVRVRVCVPNAANAHTRAPALGSSILTDADCGGVAQLYRSRGVPGNALVCGLELALADSLDFQIAY